MTTPATPAEPVRLRLGYHGSLAAARRLVRGTGRDDAAVEFSTYDVADPFRELRAGALDLMVVKYVPVEAPDVARSGTVAEDPRAVVVGAGHRLAGRDAVSIEELADEDAFDRPGSFPASVWDATVPPSTPAGRPIRRTHPMTSMPEMLRLVAEGRAVHVSYLSFAEAAPSSVRVLPIHDLPPAPVSLAWLRDAAPSAAVRLAADAEAAFAAGRAASFAAQDQAPLEEAVR